MVSALVSGSSGPGSSPGRGHCVVFLGKTLSSHNASLVVVNLKGTVSQLAQGYFIKFCQILTMKRNVCKENF